jgi:hypothetical protein
MRHSQNLFKIIAGLIFICAHLLWIGYDYLDQGTVQLLDDLNEARREIKPYISQNDALIKNFDTMVTACPKKSSCKNSIELYMHVFDKALHRFSVEVKDVPGYFDSASEFAVDNVVVPAKVLMVAMYLLMMLAFALNMLFISSKRSACCSTACGNLVYLAGLFLSLFVLVWVVVIGDLCEDNPTIQILESTPQDTLGRDYLVWYSSCFSGSNRLLVYISEGYLANASINHTISTDPSLWGSSLYEGLRALAVQNMALYELLDKDVSEGCAHIQRAWLSSVNDVLCGAYYPGMLTLWEVQTAACLCMFALFMLTPIIDRKHDKFKQIAPAPMALLDTDPPMLPGVSPRAALEYDSVPTTPHRPKAGWASMGSGSGSRRSENEGRREGRFEAQSVQHHVIRNDVDQDCREFANL